MFGCVLIAEDALLLALAERIISHLGKGNNISTRLITSGSARVHANIEVYLRAASKGIRHLIFVDLDNHACAPCLIDAWKIPRDKENFIFNVAIREAESWLLADRDGCADFLGIPVNRITPFPDDLEDPKQSFVNCCRRSKRRALKLDLLPTPGSRVSIGPLYNEVVGEFVRTKWSVEAAVSTSPSLRRCVNRIAKS